MLHYCRIIELTVSYNSPTDIQQIIT